MEAATDTSTLPPISDDAPRCAWCRGPLRHRGRYCETRCRVAGWREARRVTPAAADVTSAGGRNEDLGASSRNADVGVTVVAALYVRADGHYPRIPDVDAWPYQRDASTYEGPGPVVAHPPCAPWGKYRTIAPTRQRADLAVRAVDQVRWYGGVLEHPAYSHLWVARDLPPPGAAPDQWGGWSMFIRQSWWGHAAPKPTWLYIVGRRPGDVPEVPAPVRDPGGRIAAMEQRERELSPEAFARWLVLLARGCYVGRRNASSAPRPRNASSARSRNDAGAPRARNASSPAADVLPGQLALRDLEATP